MCAAYKDGISLLGVLTGVVADPSQSPEQRNLNRSEHAAHALRHPVYACPSIPSWAAELTRSHVGNVPPLFHCFDTFRLLELLELSTDASLHTPRLGEPRRMDPRRVHRLPRGDVLAARHRRRARGRGLHRAAWRADAPPGRASRGAAPTCGRRDR